jgi:tetratricopeptide (TPR) repeat protein
VLVPLWKTLTALQKKVLSPALGEYLSIQAFNADRGFSHTNKANVLMYQGRFKEAEQDYLNSIRIDPYFANGYINLADLYRQQKKETESINLLKQGAKAIPDNGAFPFAIGLSYIRIKQGVKASEYFKLATKVEAGNGHYHYVYGLSLEQSNTQQAQLAIRQAYVVSANPQHLYALCEMQIRHQSIEAIQCVNEFSTVGPKAAHMALESSLKRHNSN